MIKKLVVPALTLAMATFGCSSSTTPTTGTGGHAGSVATGGTTSTGGTHAGGTSGGGTSGGGTSGGGTSGGGTSGGGTSGGGHAGGASGGGTAGGGTSGGGHPGGGTSGGGTSGGGTSGGGISGGGTSGGGHPGGGAGGNGVQVMANCTTTDSAQTTALSPQVFCDNLIANCTNLPTAYATVDMCKTTYMAGVAAKQNCQSYHLCWGVEGKNNTTSPNGDPATHCQHAEGAAVCTQTQ